MVGIGERDELVGDIEQVATPGGIGPGVALLVPRRSSWRHRLGRCQSTHASRPVGHFHSSPTFSTPIRPGPGMSAGGEHPTSTSHGPPGLTECGGSLSSSRCSEQKPPRRPARLPRALSESLSSRGRVIRSPDIRLALGAVLMLSLGAAPTVAQEEDPDELSVGVVPERRGDRAHHQAFGRATARPSGSPRSAASMAGRSLAGSISTLSPPHLWRALLLGQHSWAHRSNAHSRLHPLRRSSPEARIEGTGLPGPMAGFSTGDLPSPSCWRSRASSSGSMVG